MTGPSPLCFAPEASLPRVRHLSPSSLSPRGEPPTSDQLPPSAQPPASLPRPFPAAAPCPQLQARHRRERSEGPQWHSPGHSGQSGFPAWGRSPCSAVLRPGPACSSTGRDPSEAGPLPRQPACPTASRGAPRGCFTSSRAAPPASPGAGLQGREGRGPPPAAVGSSRVPAAPSCPQVYVNAVWHGWAIPMFLFLAILRLSLNYLIAR